MKTKFFNQEEYKKVMARIHTIMKKSETNTIIREEKELRALALLAQEYEQNILGSGIVSVKSNA